MIPLSPFKSDLPLVCVQGLGFVGTAMAVAVACAEDQQGRPFYNVVGIDLPNETGKERVQSINEGKLPFRSTDKKLKTSLTKCVARNNLYASFDNSYYEVADIIIVDVPLDIDFLNPEKNNDITFAPFKKAIETFGMRAKQDCLIIVETTVPPGTCEKVVVPIIKECFQTRGLDTEKILVAHSYERVMPGENYLDSIINFWRVFSGTSDEAADLCEKFLNSIINTKQYPLRRLKHTIASETAKLLENSYRATTIAFMEEWGRYAEALNFDLFEVIDAIRDRPTHNNMRQPGFGVGGYCLTKDPLFAKWSAKKFFQLDHLDFEFCTNAVRKNQLMPIVSVDYSKKLLGTLKGKTILICGISYRQDVGDTRYSASEAFYRNATQRGAKVICHDPLCTEWPELGVHIHNQELPLENVDLVVFAVQHKIYQNLDLGHFAQKFSFKILDGNRTLTHQQRQDFVNNGGQLYSIGRGETV